MYKNLFFFLILFSIICITYFVIHKIVYNVFGQENFSVPTGHERPFVNIYGQKKNNKEQLNIILLSHPFTRDNSWLQYNNYLRDKFLVLGISSYSEFPKITSNKLDSLHDPKNKAWTYDYMTVVKGWLHCFREPEKYIKTEIPKILISESDFCDYNLFKPNKEIKKIYDFIYLCPKDSESDSSKKNECFGWVATNKNWKLALHCLKILCGKYKLKGLLVGRNGCKLPEECKGLIETTGFLGQSELIKKYRQSKFIFIPNKVDASPRVLTEGLCCGIPVLVNYNLLGGWKYVNNETGAFFKTPEDMNIGIEFILNGLEKNTLKPRDNFIKNFGKEVSGKKFKKFIIDNFSDYIDVSQYEYLCL
jgi:glycosyltransferase involved in cell wall biosynthesis